jgi:hypothetical protein
LPLAYAKLHGNYAILDAGLGSDALTDLTGCIVQVIDMKFAYTKPSEINSQKSPEDKLWKDLKFAQKNNCLISCTNKSGNEPSRERSRTAALSHGIILAHSYSVTQVVNLRTNVILHRDKYRLVLLRNVSHLVQFYVDLHRY